MKVDMSPEAVTARLRTMDELWLLSMKLMDAKKVDQPTQEAPDESRVREDVETGGKSPNRER